MRIRIMVGQSAERIGWTMVKLFGLVVVAGALISSTSRGVMKPSMGLRTVLPASIRAGLVETITVPFSARVKEVLVSPGVNVQAGQLLAVLESQELDRQVQRAQRHLELLRSRTRGTSRTPSRSDELQLKGAERSLELARGRLERHSVGDAENAYRRALKQKERLAVLVQQRLATAGELSLAEREADNELRNLRAAEELRSRLEQEVETFETQVAILRSYSRPEPAASTSESEIDEASALLDDLLGQRESLQVKAPRAGVVLSGVASPGDRIFAGGSIVQLADMNRLSFEAPVSATIARQVRPGTPVRIRVPTEPPRQVDAEVSSVALVPDPLQQSYVIRAVIANPDPSVILVGMEGAMEFPHSESMWRRLF